MKELLRLFKCHLCEGDFRISLQSHTETHRVVPLFATQRHPAAMQDTLLVSDKKNQCNLPFCKLQICRTCTKGSQSNFYFQNPTGSHKDKTNNFQIFKCFAFIHSWKQKSIQQHQMGFACMPDIFESKFCHFSSVKIVPSSKPA